MQSETESPDGSAGQAVVLLVCETWRQVLPALLSSPHKLTISQAVVLRHEQLRVPVYCGLSSRQRPGFADSEMERARLGLAACPALILPCLDPASQSVLHSMC